MRGGVRLPAVIVAIGLLTGCSDPSGAARRERAAAARKATPRPSAPATAPAESQSGATWWQAPRRTRTAGGLKVTTGALREGRMKIIVIDVAGHVRRRLTVTQRPRTLAVGRFTLTDVVVRLSPKRGVYGVAFRYRTH